MSFDDRLALLSSDILNACRNKIKSRSCEFFTWLKEEASRDMAKIYVTCCHAIFEPYITRYTEEKMVQAGIHLIYAVDAYRYMENIENLETIQEYAEEYIRYQFEDFDSWCKEVRVNYNRPPSAEDTGSGEAYGFRTLDASRPTLRQFLEHP